MKDDVSGLITERERTVGDFTEQSEVIEYTLEIWMGARNWGRLAPFQKQALRMLLHKVGRVLVGDPNEVDHWRDGEGYLRLARQRLPLAHPRLAPEPLRPGTPEDGGHHARDKA
jgi:hypothetical protein